MKKRFYIGGALLILLMTCLAFAQHPPAKPAPPPPAADKSAAPAKDAPPTLTEIESLQLENLQLKATLLQQRFNETPDMQQLQHQFVALIAGLNAEHPGWVFNQQTRAFVKQPAKPALPPTPPAAAPEAKK